MRPTFRVLETQRMRGIRKTEENISKKASLHQDFSNCGIVTSKGTRENFKGVRSPGAQSPRPTNSVVSEGTTIFLIVSSPTSALKLFF